VDGRHGTDLSQLEGAADGLDDLRSFVTVSRTHRTDVGDRQVYVRLDDKRVKLMFGECYTAEVLPGSHHLRVHNTLVWKNIHFVLEAGEHLEFVIINSGRWWTWGFAGVLGSAPLFLRVERRNRA
jgi:hypothetical protein